MWRFAFFFLCVCFPFGFSSIGPLTDVLWIELLAPVVFLSGFWQQLMSGQPLFPAGCRFTITAVFVLLIWNLIHFTLHPVFGSNLLGSSASGSGLRAYYSVAMGIFVFFSLMWFAGRNTFNENDWSLFLKVAVCTAMGIGMIRLVTYFLGLEMPLLKGAFDYNEEAFTIDRAHRIGGLSEAGTLGFAALLALYLRRPWGIFFYISMAIFSALMVMSGGRASMTGVLMALIVYFLLIKNEFSKTALVGIGLLVLGLAVLQLDVVQLQFTRLSSIEGGFAANSPGRALVFKEMWEIFLNAPVLGKGIGLHGIDGRLEPFVVSQLMAGGHGSYPSILAIYGLGGAFFLMTTLFIAGIRGIRYLRWTLNYNSPEVYGREMMVCFGTLSLVILSVEFVAGGNGVNNLRLFFMSGLVVGFVSRPTRVKL